MRDQTWAMIVFLVAFCLLVHLLRGIWRTAVSTEFKNDLRRLREQRRRRKEARRAS